MARTFRDPFPPPIEPDDGRDVELRRLLASFYKETWALARTFDDSYYRRLT